MGEVEKLDAAVINLDGDALAWFQWVDGRRPIRDWTELKTIIQERFRPTQEGTTYQQFLALRQVGTVDEYRRQFELLAASLNDIPDTIQE